MRGPGIVLFATALIGAGAGLACGGGPQGLRSANPDERLAAYESARAARQKVIEEAIDVLRSREDPKGQDDLPRELAIDLLALYRAPEGVPALLGALDYVSHGFRVESGPLSEYPAALALVKIGSPSVDPAVKHLGKTDSEHEQKLLVQVLKSLLGRNGAEEALTRGEAFFADPKRYEAVMALLGPPDRPYPPPR